MTPNEYQELASRTECNQLNSLSRMSSDGELDPVHATLPIRLNHSVIGLAGEVGELASLMQKWIYYGKEFARSPSSPDESIPTELRDKMVEEYGDVLWYVALGLNALGVNFENVMYGNIEKLKVRYPSRYEDFHAADENRNRKAELKAVENALVKSCHYCSNPAVYVLTWLKDKQQKDRKISVPWCGCDLHSALKKFWPAPYKVVRGVDYEYEPISPAEPPKAPDYM